MSLTVTAAGSATAASPVVGLVGSSGVRSSVPQLVGHVQPGFARTGTGLTDATGHDTGVAGIAVDLAPSATIIPVVRDWWPERRAPVYPADYPGVIGAGAVDASAWPPSWANVGPSVDLVAPDDHIRVRTRDGGTTLTSGTSYSAAHIAGVADLRAGNPTWTATQNIDHLTATARDLGAPGRDWWFGDGLVTP